MDERLRFWLERVLQEKIQDAKKILDRISILSYQIQNNEMAPRYKHEVVNDLLHDLKDKDWMDAYEEVQQEFQK